MSVHATGSAPPTPDDLLEEGGAFDGTEPGRVLIVACGAIAREVLAVVSLNGWEHVTVRCLPGKLHQRPQLIAGAVDAKLQELEGGFERVFVAYADCGTGGALDLVLERHGVERLEGAHCYGFFTGNAAFEALHEDDPFTYYLTDFLARHFDALVIRGMKLDRHPELMVDIFGNYRRLVYLSQSHDPDLLESARRAADTLGLEFEHRHTGYGELQPALERFVNRLPVAPTAHDPRAA